MSRFFVSYREGSCTEYYCTEAPNAIKATERFCHFCEKHRIDPVSFRITKAAIPKAEQEVATICECPDDEEKGE